MSLFGHKVLDNKDISKGKESLSLYNFNDNNSTIGYNYH